MVLRSTGNDQDAEEHGGDRERSEDVPHAHGRNVVAARPNPSPDGRRTRLPMCSRRSRSRLKSTRRAATRCSRRFSLPASQGSCSSTRTTSSTTPASRSCRPSGRSRSSSAPTGRGLSSCRGSRSSMRSRSRRSTASSTTSSTRATHVRRTSLATALADAGLTGRIGADQDGYPWILGYRGPTLSELSGATVVRVVEQIEARWRSSPRPRSRSSARVSAGGTSHTGCSSGTRASASRRPRCRSVRATRRRSRCSTRSARSTARRASSRAARTQATADRSAATRRSRMPSPGTSCSSAGDVLVTGASAPVWGYLSELERTMFVGEPTPEQERMFAHMVGLQDIAFDAIRPGARCSDVDRRGARRTSTSTISGRTGGTTPGTRSACATTRAPSSTRATTPRSARGWCSRSSRASTRPSSAAIGTRTPCSLRSDGIEILTYYPRDLASLIVPV